MDLMRRGWALLAWAVIVMGMGVSTDRLAWAQQDEGPMSNMHFVVMGERNGKPIKNAAVVLHPVTRKGKQAMGGLELKTNEDGKTGIDGIPYGPLRVQVIAPGFQTFGEDYQVNQAEMEITIKLKPPARQYSTYGVQESKKTGDKNSGDSPGAGKKPDDGKTEPPKPQ
jgi:hypothetical protein